MPISHETKWYGVNDAKIAKLTADPAGGAATYGTLIDVPGIKSVGITGDVNSVELRGDGKRLDQSSVLSGLSLTFEGAKQSIDVLVATVGGTVVDAGTGSTETVTYTLLGSDVMNYFKFEAQTLGVDTISGDGHLLLHKCILSSAPALGMAEEDYQTSSIEAVAMPLLSTDKLLTAVLNETAAAIA